MKDIFKYIHIISIVLFCLLTPPLLAQEAADYNKTIEIADRYFEQGDYINAKASYQYAVQLNPTDQYPKDKLQETLGLIKVQMEKSNMYATRIMVADEYYNSKDYINALALYKEALTFLPKDKYANDRVTEINQMMQDARLNEEKYNAHISEGEKMQLAGDLEKALDRFTEASELKPGEAYPRQKIAELNELITKKKALADEFGNAMQLAENYLAREKYEEAIAEYEKALELKPDNTEVATALEEARKLKEAADAYTQLIQEGDNFYIEKRFSEAKAKYEQALVLTPNDDYPKRMLEKVDIAMQDITQSNQSDYEIAIARADRLYNEKDYEAAIGEYNNALRFKPDGEYAKKRIEDINNTLRLRQITEDAYNQSISKADNLFKAEQYEEAFYEYKNAISYKPLEKYPKVKMDEIETILADLQNQKDIYNSIIAGADKLFFADDYVDARIQYRKALAMFPEDPYPKNQIIMINEILGERDVNVKVMTESEGLYEVKQPTAEELALREFELKMQFGDELFLEGKYDEALVAYKEALEILPSQGTAQEKIAETESKLDEIATAEALALAEQKALEEERLAEEQRIAEEQRLAEEQRALAAQQALDQQYNDALAQADEHFAKGDYALAIVSYKQAEALKPGDTELASKIEASNLALQEIENKKVVEEQYAATLAEADQYFVEGDYTFAIVAYRSALELKPGESYPTEKISEIQSIQQAEQAREELDRKYSEALTKAEGDFTAGELTEALAAYKSAALLKPEESLPQERIASINATLGEIAAQEALDKQYADAISQADAFLAAGDLAAAKAEYEKARALKPAEGYAQQQLALVQQKMDDIAAQEELDRLYADAISRADELFGAGELAEALAAYQTASNLKPGESQPREQIATINATLQEIADREALDRQYADAISQADALLAAGNLAAAKAEYEKALALKPGEGYAQQQLASVQQSMDDIAAQEELDRQYADAISQADALLAAGSYAEAMAKFQEASNLKPSEEYPRTRINEIVKIQDEIARQAEIDSLYAEAIAFADKHFAAGDYENATREYKVANGLKPQEAYAEDQLFAIEEILAEQERIKEIENKYNAAIARGGDLVSSENFEEAILAYQEALLIKPEDEFARAKLAETQQSMATLEAKREEMYSMAVLNADNYFAQGELEMAKLEYERASGLKPEEVYPLDQLKKVNEEMLRKKQIVQEAYDKAIADADKFYAGKIYDDAIEAYRTAAELKPSENYPKEMSKRILKLLSERAIVQINKDPVLIKDNTTRKFDFIPVPVKDRKSNYIFFKATSKTEESYKVIISFGAGGAKNGGLVLRVPRNIGSSDFIVRISAQYKWFSEDNDWITFYPEGGDIEVSLVQISYSD